MHQGKTILFMMASATGHLNATYSFGHVLLAAGYRVVYAVQPEHKAVVARQGFETVLCPTQLFASRDPLGISNDSVFDRFFEKIADRLTGELDKVAKERVREMRSVVRELQPDLLLLDSFLSYNYLLLDYPKLPVLSIQTMLSTTERSGLPPLNSPLSIGYRRKAQWAWQKWRLRRGFKRLTSFGTSPLQVTLRLLGDKKKEANEQLEHTRLFQPGIKGIPELHMAPQAIDLPEFGTPKHTCYLGSQMNRSRKETLPDPAMQKLLIRMEYKKVDEKWIYCSLGTLSLIHNKKATDFLQKVVAAFRQKPNWKLVLSTGMIPPSTFKNRPGNVWIYGTVPQMEILARCDAFITHGGLNSVLEAIDNRVPMLVYPLNNKWDQNGNAARVEYYGLGIKGNIKRATPKNITAGLQALLASAEFNTPLKSMQERIDAEVGMEKGLAQVRQVLTQRGKNAENRKIL